MKRIVKIRTYDIITSSLVRTFNPEQQNRRVNNVVRKQAQKSSQCKIFTIFVQISCLKVLQRWKYALLRNTSVPSSCYRYHFSFNVILLKLGETSARFRATASQPAASLTYSLCEAELLCNYPYSDEIDFYLFVLIRMKRHSSWREPKLQIGIRFVWKQ